MVVSNLFAWRELRDARSMYVSGWRRHIVVRNVSWRALVSDGPD
jgi:hypothetical protein